MAQGKISYDGKSTLEIFPEAQHPEARWGFAD